MKKYKKVLIYLLFICLPGFLAANESSNRELTFLTWSDYIDPVVIETFEKQYSIKVRIIYFDSDDQRDEVLVDTDAAGYDVILSSDISLVSYKKAGWLAPVTEKQVPNLKYIDKKWIDPIEGAKGYSVPYFWGTLGIAYRKDLVGFEVNSWKQLFQPAPELHKKILMLDGSADVVNMALKSLGYSANSTSRKEINEAKLLLQKQKQYVYSYTVPVLDENSLLVKGDVYMAMSYSGDTIMLKDVHPDIEYVLPKEGGNIWVDFLIVSSKSKHKDLAYEFINYLNEPDVAAQIAQYVYYASPNLAAEKLLPEDFLKDPVIYPSLKSLEKSEVYKKLPPRIQKLRNNIYSGLIH